MLKKKIGQMLRYTSRKLSSARLSRLCRTPDRDTARLLKVLRICLDGKFSDEETAAMALVEVRRLNLEASSLEIQLIDFGAGTPTAGRTADEMERGVVHYDTVGAMCKRASKSTFWTRLLFALIREYRPRHCLELGTCLGISAGYQTAALQLNGDGMLVTLEGSPSLAAIATQGLTEQTSGSSHVRVLTGRFKDTLPDAIQLLQTIDYAFIDGHHDEQATLDYFRTLKPQASSHAIFVFDDIAWSRGMRNAWKIIRSDPDVQLVLNLGMLGVCILGPRDASRFQLTLPMY